MAKIMIKGDIINSDYQDVYDWLGYEATSPKSVRNEIAKANGEDLEVEINSGGGDVFSGSEIYTELKSYKGNVTVKIVGLAASAATVIAMAGDTVQMSPTAQFMIHNVSLRASGDYHDMNLAADILTNANDTIANAYRIKTGMAQEDLLAMMDKETWLTAEKAKEYGFVDEIMFENKLQFVASVGGGLPADVIKKIKNKLVNEAAQKNAAVIFMQQTVDLNEKELYLMGVLNNA